MTCFLICAFVLCVNGITKWSHKVLFYATDIGKPNLHFGLPLSVSQSQCLNIDKSELLIDQLSRVLTHMNVNMVINFIFDLWQERKSKLYC